ncbi:protein kinase [Thalassotalea sp. G20_0]|uniref:protein kinase domain-containing protein n=1 Tax=Thalassotalea sp. G20_0 TaxID=2821093 RepID=UPI00336AA3D0
MSHMITNANQEALPNTHQTSIPTSPASSPSGSIEVPAYGARFAHWLVSNYKKSLVVLLCATSGYQYLKCNSRTSLADHRITSVLLDTLQARLSFLQAIESTDTNNPTVSRTSIECLFDPQSFQRFMDTHFKSLDYPHWYQTFLKQDDTCSAGEGECQAVSDDKGRQGEAYDKPCQQRAGFRFHSELGTGGFYPVYRMTTEDGQPFTMKVINDPVDYAQENLINRSLLSFTGKGSEYLARLIGTSSPESPLNYLITEAFDSTLRDFLSGLDGAPDKHRTQSIFRQMLKGVQAIHDARLTHNDLKPDNIFISANGDIKIANFASAGTIGWIHDMGTAEYRAPEKLLHFINARTVSCYDLSLHNDPNPRKVPCGRAETSNEKTDNWSLGVILAQLVLGDPFLLMIEPDTLRKCKYSFHNPGGCVLNQLSKQQALITRRLRDHDLDAADLFSRLIESSPTERITLEEALKHPFMQEDNL